MALDIIDDTNDPDKKKDQSQAAPPQAGDAPAGQAAPAGQGPQASNRSGSGFVNLQNIISANRQNKLGSTINQGMQGVAGNVRQGVDSNQQLFQSEMDKNRLGTDKDVQNRQNILNKVSGYQAPTGQVNTAGQGPNAQAATYPTGAAQPPAAPGSDLVNDQEAQDFARYRAGQYNGPQSLRDADELSSQAQQAQQLGQNISSTGGRQALLQQFVGHDANYSRGKQALDSLLLGQTGAKDLRQARQATSGLGNEVSGAENLAEQQGLSASSLAKQFGQDTNNTLGGIDTTAKTGTGMLGDIYKGLNTDLGAKQAGADKEYQDFQSRLANKQLSQSDMEKYVNPLMGGNQLFGLDQNDLTKGFNESKFGLEDVADNTKAAKLNALQKLSGTNAVQLDPTKIGVAKNNINLDDTQFKDYQAKQKQYQDMVNPYQQILAQAKQRQTQNADYSKRLQQTFSDISKNDADKTPAERAAHIHQALLDTAGDHGLGDRSDVQDALRSMASQYDPANGDSAALAATNNLNSLAGLSTGQDDGSISSPMDWNRMLGAGADNTRVSQAGSVVDALNQKFGVKGSLQDLMSNDAKTAYNQAHPQAAPQMIGNNQDFTKFSDNHFHNASNLDLGDGTKLSNLFSGEGLHNVLQWSHGGLVRPQYSKLSTMMRKK